MSDASITTPTVDDHPYLAELEREKTQWTEIARICHALSDADRERPGYYRDPDWSVKDAIGHLGAWMADAEQHLLRIEAGTEVDEPRDIDALNAQYLAAFREQDWTTVWLQAISARTQMLAVWARLPERNEVADAWVRKAGAEHDTEHLPRLRAWVDELRAADPAPR